MRETSFIKQNKKKWKEFEKTMETTEPDPEKLNELYVKITDDLSYSRTFYPNRSVRVYLNNLAQQVFHTIYKTKQNKSSKFITFWTEELPQLVYHSRKEFRLATIIFVTSFLIGALSSAMDIEFPRTILGDDYVDMTIENIDSGDPMAVYKSKGAMGMSIGIAMNNIFVAFLTFVLGALFAVGTIGLLISNGVMVGAFQYFFIEKGVFWESFLTIWTHGTLEIASIIIAGAAGLTMGKGLVFPGTFSRAKAFQISARRGLKIMIGITPIFILAAFIEGFMTRWTETPDIIRLLFILACLFFILGYFYFYPRSLAAKGFKTSLQDEKPTPDKPLIINTGRIKTSGEIFSDVFIFYRNYFKQFAVTALFATSFYCLMVFMFGGKSPSALFTFPYQTFGIATVFDQFFMNPNLPYLPLVNVLIYSVLTFVGFSMLIKHTGKMPPKKGRKKTYFIFNFLKIVLVTVLWNAIFYLDNPFLIFLGFMFITPIILFYGYIMFVENIDPFTAIAKTFSTYSKKFSQLYGAYFLISFVGILFFFILDTMLAWFYIDMIGWNINLEQESKNELLNVLLTFSSIFTFTLITVAIVSSVGLIYYSILEVISAKSLKERIANIGTTKKIKGLDREG